MKDLIIVMTHGKAAQTTARHEPYWKQLGHLVYLTPENDPLPGRDRPSASVGQVIGFAGKIPEHEAHVGHACCSIGNISSSLS